MAASIETLADEKSFTPREIVSELDKFIIGQDKAKRAVALALRNRWRRKRVSEPLRDDIVPKNIILIGATGVGKTEIARRLAKLAQAPFIKVEASKFTEVGYVGRDVDSIIRDLVEAAMRLVQQEAKTRGMGDAQSRAEERILDLLLPKPAYEQSAASRHAQQGASAPQPPKDASRERLRAMLRAGELNHRQVEVNAEDKRVPLMPIFSGQSTEEMGMGLQDIMGQMLGKRTYKRRLPISEAMVLLTEQEAQKLIDPETAAQEAVLRTEQSGIVFLDEIDKIARREGGGGGGGGGPDVSREGVQRDILPIVEGSTIKTKYGPVRTDHILFIAAGAFHVAKVSDLIPELQGRFPIRVALDALGEPELRRILCEPQNALPIQYTALLDAENVALTFTPDALTELARVAAEANNTAENIGARRLHTVLEKLLEDVSFAAPERGGTALVIDAAYVRRQLADFLHNDDLKRYIL